MFLWEPLIFLQNFTAIDPVETFRSGPKPSCMAHNIRPEQRQTGPKGKRFKSLTSSTRDSRPGQTSTVMAALYSADLLNLLCSFGNPESSFHDYAITEKPPVSTVRQGLKPAALIQSAH